MTTFQENKNYTMKFKGDADLKLAYTCIKRTAKTVIFKSDSQKEIIKKRIKNFDGIEYISFDGCNIYSDNLIN